MFSALATAATFNINPFLAFNYWVEIEGLLVFGFSEVTGLASSIEVTDHREGGVNHYVHQLPSQVTQSNLTLKKGLTPFDVMWDWYYETTQGIIKRKNGTIMLMNDFHLPVMSWDFHNAFPAKWTGPSFNASGNEIAFSSLELVHEGISRPMFF
ncbi:MAG: phage tail protein [Aestuariibacter sp.]|nr:phage tail protein [Aestuariibacter sp.]